VSGSPLSHAIIPVNVTANQTTPVKGVLNGVVTSVNLQILAPPQLSGASNSSQIVVTAYDWDGNVIIAPGAYDSPITLTTAPMDPTSPTGAISVSPLALNKPGDAATISFDGKSYTNVVVTANYPQWGFVGRAVEQYKAFVIVTPAIASTEFALPSGELRAAR